MKICMISTSHGISDDRFYWKEAISLKNYGYEVICIVVSNKNEMGRTKEGIQYIKIKRRKYTNKIVKKILSKKFYKYILKLSAKINADVYHLHDLNLNFIGAKLKKLPNKPKVIYDVYESYPDMIRDYISTKGIKTIIKNIYSIYKDKWEIKCSRNYDLIITADDAIAKRFRNRIKNKNIEEIYNFTDLINYDEHISYEQKKYDVIYCGSITKVRGIFNILEAIKIGKKTYDNNIKLLLLGPFNESGLKKEVIEYINYNNLQNNITVKGRVPHKSVPYYLRQSRIGIVTLLPISKYYKNIPTKQFEYMMFGLPVVGSDLPPIKKYVKESETGEIVNPMEPKEICNAIYKILNNRNLYEYYSHNGIKAAKEKYNWRLMENKLICLYNTLI